MCGYDSKEVPTFEDVVFVRLLKSALKISMVASRVLITSCDGQTKPCGALVA